MMQGFVMLALLAAACGPAAVVGYPEGAPPESCYQMNVNHTDNFGRPRLSRDCGPDCDHSLEIAGAVVSGSNRARIEGNGSVTTYECGTVYEILLNSSGQTFEGYLVEARATTQSGEFEETSSIWGEWIYDGNDPFHAVLCDRSIADDEGPFPNAVTQNYTYMEFTNISLYWKAPDQPNTIAEYNALPESLTFWVTIVEDVANSFFPIKGPVVLARDCREPPEHTPSSPTPSLSPSPSLSPPMASTSQPAVPPVTSESQPGPSPTPMDEEDDEEDDGATESGDDSGDSGSGTEPGSSPVCPLEEGYDYVSFLSRGYLDSLGYSGSYQVPRYDDGVSAEISIEDGVPFGDKTHYRAWVGTNGLVSFETPYYGWWATNFPSIYPCIRNSYIVAPFWNDYDIRLRGNIWYSTIYADGLSPEYYNTTVLYTWSQFIANQTGINPYSFQGTWALVATWEDVPHYPHFWAQQYPQDYSTDYLEQLEETSTFQAIIITDTVQTYAIFTYMCGEDGTSTYLSPGIYRYAVVGYNAFGVKFDTYALSARRSVDSVACVNFDENSERCGLTSNLIYQLNVGEDERQPARKECRRLLNEDSKENGDYRNSQFSGIITEVEPCPCSIWQAWREWGRFRTTSPDYWCFYQVQPRIYAKYSFTQQCCYKIYTSFSEPWGALVTNGTRASTVLYYHPRFNPRGYSEEIALRETCCGLAGLCDVYLNPDYGARPVDNCSNYVPPVWTWGRGDPHIKTLDGRDYTFNGLGEYILSQTLETNPEFYIQGRTSQVPDVQATEFTAFCFGNNISRVMVSNCAEDGSCTVLFDGVDISANLTEVNSTYEYNSILLMHSSNNETIASVSGVAVVFSLSSGGLLNFVVTMPERLIGLVEGLMGNFDGNATNDLISRNGDLLYNNASDRMIHENFGVTWQVTGEESCFIYEGGETYNTYARDGNFTPTFADELVATPEIEQACQGNAQCIYDYALTNDSAIGMGTLATTMNNEENEAQSNNFPPSFSGGQLFNVTVGYANVYQFFASDDQDEAIDVYVASSWQVYGVLEPVAGSPGYYMFTVDLTEVSAAEFLAANVYSLVFSASDSLGTYGELNPRVVVYPCTSNGNATALGEVMAQGTTEFLYCECSEGYDGQFCEGDRDDCVQQPCGEEAECVDNPAPMVGVTCVCPDGFNVTEDGTRCLDLDECVDMDICEQICTNTEGSYECSCWPGYQVVEGDPMMCEDINECELQLNGCQHICTNNDGGYDCSCRMGFELDMDNLTCSVGPGFQCPEPNACEDTCVMLDVATCGCSAGYELNTDTISCRDIDECSMNNGGCAQNCTNGMGSFYCSCYDGYILGANGRQCNDLEECDLMGTCQLSTFLQQQIGVVDQCTALVQLYGMIPDCEDGQVCYNKPGSYQCICPAGTILVLAAGDVMSCQVPVVVEEGTTQAVVASFPGLTVDQFIQGDGLSNFVGVTNNAARDHCGAQGTTCRFTEVEGEEEEDSLAGRRRKRQSSFVDISTTTINTVVDLDSVMADSQGNLVFNFYVEVTAADGTKYILDVNDLLTAVQANSTQQAYLNQLGVSGQFSALNEEEDEDDDDDLELWAWILIGVGCSVIGLGLSLLLTACLYCIAKLCFSDQARSDKKAILPADHDLKQLSDPREGVGVTVVENPLAEQTTDPSY